MTAKPLLRFFFEWKCDTCLWCGNDAAEARFEASPIDPVALGLSPTTLARMQELAEWHDQSLNWDSPLDPGPWRQKECDRFNRAAKELFETVRRELGDAYELVNHQPEIREDPHLDIDISLHGDVTE